MSLDNRRQPRPVTITIEGEPEDVNFWHNNFKRRAEFSGDSAVNIRHEDWIKDGQAKLAFRIFPRAIND